MAFMGLPCPRKSTGIRSLFCNAVIERKVRFSWLTMGGTWLPESSTHILAAQTVRSLLQGAILHCTTDKIQAMLYQIYETQRNLMEPFADFAQAAAKLYSYPLSPFGQNPFAQRVSAGYDLMYRLWKDYEKPKFGITSVDVDGSDVAIHD